MFLALNFKDILK